MTPRHVALSLGPEEAGKRLDLVLARRLQLGRRRTRELFDDGRVREAGRRLRKGDSAREGQAVVVQLPAPDLALPEPELAVDVLFASEHCLIVNKPGGQPTVARRGSDRGTLANALVGRFPELAAVGHGMLEPGLVHRLDVGTSGLVVVARTTPAFIALRDGLRRGEWRKRYLAIVSRPPPAKQGKIEGWLFPARHSSRRVAFSPSPVADVHARAASCTWEVLERADRATLVEVEVAKAYRHQVRVLMASLGSPLIGDSLYGGEAGTLPVHRHALHASYIAWNGTVLVPGFCVEAALPDELLALLRPAG